MLVHLRVRKHRHERILQLLNSLELNPKEVSEYVVHNSSVPYTRRRVATDGHSYELLLLQWNPLKYSMIHDHPGDGCYIKVVSGSIAESIYDRFTLNKVQDSVASTGDVCYMDDNIGLHKIGNPSARNSAITLHLYTPPITTCKVLYNTMSKSII